MPPPLLLTQCLQNDFVKPAGRYEPLANLLHVGHEEARRLAGEVPAEGPVARVMRWAYGLPRERLGIVHIRDWHDPSDPAQASHLRQFGPHCLKGTPGAAFAFEEPGLGRAEVVDSLTLNDFHGTRLAGLLAGYAGTRARVGVMGVWTEAKVTFLAYELRTRFPDLELAVCSALTASSSRASHFLALDQLQKLLGVLVIPSVGEFARFLGGGDAALPLKLPSASDRPSLAIEGPEVPETDRALLRYLFRDASAVTLRRLDGGFSGNLVAGTQSVDALGHAQVPHVVKIGPEEPIGRERAAFERVEAVLGNNAPRIADFADLGGRGAIKYRYAAMGGGSSTTFQKLYASGLEAPRLRRILDEVFLEQLGRFYRAASRERCNLLEYYWFKPEVAPRVRARVEDLVGPAGETIRLGSREVANPCLFYERELARLLPSGDGAAYFAYVHGDLNGANIIVDGHENVWLIDFFHTHRGHVLKDLLKLENDLLYIFTPVEDEAALEECFALTEQLVGLEDLGRPLPPPAGRVRRPGLVRAWETAMQLRSYYPELIRSDRDPAQALIGMLRYAAHTLSFDESSRLQKLWALYAMSVCAAELSRRIERGGPLRVDWLEERYTRPGRLGITILPGRRDYGRDLAADVSALRNQGATHVAGLLSTADLHDYGVEGLLAAYRAAGLDVRHLAVADQGVPSQAEMRALVDWLGRALAAGGRAVLHCVGGLGRSGTAAACLLKAYGCGSDEAMAAVRRARTERAIESPEQEEFVRSYAGRKGG